MTTYSSFVLCDFLSFCLILSAKSPEECLKELQSINEQLSKVTHLSTTSTHSTPVSQQHLQSLLKRAQLLHRLQCIDEAFKEATVLISATSNLSPLDPSRFGATICKAECLRDTQQYEAATQLLKSYMLQCQSAAKAATTDSSVASESSVPPVTLPQVLSSLMPLLRSLSKLTIESSGDYDLHQLIRESFDAAKQIDGEHWRRNDLTPIIPSAHLTPDTHAEFVHPNLLLGVMTPDAGRGIVASSEKKAIPANSLLMVSKPLLFILGKELLAAANAISGSANVSSSSSIDGKAPLRTILREKLRTDRTLAPQLLLLDGGDKYAAQRDAQIRKMKLSVSEHWSNASIRRLINGLATGSIGSEEVLDLEQLEAILHRNTFTPNSKGSASNDNPSLTNSVDEEGGGLGIYLLASLFNHSCRPNAVWFIIGDMHFVRSIRTIEPGEQVFISYAHCATLSFEHRQKLLQDLGFTCRCVWCCSYFDEYSGQEEEEEGRGDDGGRKRELIALESQLIPSSASNSNTVQQGPYKSLYKRSEDIRVKLLGMEAKQREKERNNLQALINEFHATIMKSRVALQGEREVSSQEKQKNDLSIYLQPFLRSSPLTPASSSSDATNDNHQPCFSLTHLYTPYLYLSHLLSLQVQLLATSTQASSANLQQSLRVALDQHWGCLQSAAAVDALISGVGYHSNLLSRFEACKVPLMLLRNGLISSDVEGQEILKKVKNELFCLVRDHHAYYGVNERNHNGYEHFRYYYDLTMERIQMPFEEFMKQAPAQK